MKLAACLLVPVENNLILTVSGKRGFTLPGGKFDEKDQSFKETACRECWEETRNYVRPSELELICTGLATRSAFVYVYRSAFRMMSEVQLGYSTEEGVAELHTESEILANCTYAPFMEYVFDLLHKRYPL